MPGTIIASGTVLVDVINDIGSQGVNSNTNSDVAHMKPTSLVFLSVRSGTPDGVNAPANGYPNGYGPIFNATITLKGTGSFNFVVSAVEPNRWSVQRLPVDYIVIS